MAEDRQIEYDYNDVPTVRAFAKDKHFIACIIGPYGSGKSAGCVIKNFNLACKQQPDKDGIRKTRIAVVRNTYQQLTDTTKKTIQEWLPFAKWKESDHSFTIDIRLEDGTTVYSEWLLRALDRPDQIQNLLSLELTRAWLNEARELPKEVFDNVQARVDRYPVRIPIEGKIDEFSYGPTNPGLDLDTNPPDTDHWIYKHFEDIRPANSIIFHQPSGRSEQAENRRHLSPTYYENLMQGKDADFIRVYVDGQYGYLKEGKPVFSNYNDTIHCFKEELKPIVGLPVVVGVDFGLMPAAVFTQIDSKGRLYIIDELIGQFMDFREFLTKLVKPLLRNKYLFMNIIFIGDPAGRIRSQVDSITVYHEFKAQGLKAKSAKTNAIQARLGAVNMFLTRMIEGKPGFILSPNCTFLRRAMLGKYKYRRMLVSGERYTDTPDKNEFSHVADGLQYACLEQEIGFPAANAPSLGRLGGQTQPPLSSQAWT